MLSTRSIQGLVVMSRREGSMLAWLKVWCRRPACMYAQQPIGTVLYVLL